MFSRHCVGNGKEKFSSRKDAFRKLFLGGKGPKHICRNEKNHMNRTHGKGAIGDVRGWADACKAQMLKEITEKNLGKLGHLLS